MVRIAADVGGTFTDIALIDSEGHLRTRKVPSTPANYSDAVVAGATDLLRDCGIDRAEVRAVLHGCTVATNAILERKGAKTALITTRGFRDVLELRRIRTPTLYDPLYVKPAPLVPRRYRYEVTERLDAAGEVVTPLDDEDVRQVAARIAATGIEAVAVCLLHSYRNPAHERRVGAMLRDLLPGCYISLSVDVNPRMREYERTSTVVINSYVGPPVRNYLGRLTDRLRGDAIDGDLLVMQSAGGIIAAETAIEQPAQIVECGPAAGVVGALKISRRTGYGNLITFDMGGTTAKASLIENGQLQLSSEYEVGGEISMGSRLMNGGGYALNLPAIDISEIGAGGGSIVWTDRADAIKVGPHSAGAFPGPACYPAGGEDATVTDANVVLGYLNGEALAGGEVRIEAARARAAIRRIADRLGQEPEICAHGIVSIAASNMVRAIKAVTTHRGRDPRDFSLLAFGGNGGVFAAALARTLRIPRVIVPPGAGVFSAVGLLCADIQRSVTRTYEADLLGSDPAALRAVFADLEADLRGLLGGQAALATFGLFAELRYRGQAFELTLPLTGAVDPAQLADLSERFEIEHERLYGHRFSGNYPVQVIAVRVVATIETPAQPLRPAFAATDMPEALREVYFGPEFGRQATPVIGRTHLTGRSRPGPLIVEEYEGTTVVPPGWSAAIDDVGNIVLTCEE